MATRDYTINYGEALEFSKDSDLPIFLSNIKVNQGTLQDLRLEVSFILRSGERHTDKPIMFFDSELSGKTEAEMDVVIKWKQELRFKNDNGDIVIRTFNYVTIAVTPVFINCEGNACSVKLYFEPNNAKYYPVPASF
jgi:hypothetical protein